MRQALLDERPPAVTKLLLYANVAVFVIGLILAQQQQIPLNQYLFVIDSREVAPIWHATGALHVSDLRHGEWWRLVSYCFVHFGGLHILMNMYGLYILGPMVERMWGRWRYLLMYLAAGLCGGAAQVIINPIVLMGGASGALCGILASMGVWVMLNRPYLPPTIASSWMRSIIINVFLITIISLFPGVSWAGHLGGAIAGAIIAVPLVYSRFGRGAQSWLGTAGAFAVPVAGLLLAVASVGGWQVQPDQGAQAEQRERPNGQKKKANGDAPPTAEERKLRDLVNRKLTRLDELVATTQDRYALPLMKIRKAMGPNGKEQLKAMVAAFTKGEETADNLVKELTKFGRPSGARAKKEWDLAGQYAEACKQYFMSLNELAGLEKLTKQSEMKLSREWDTIRFLRGRLQTTMLWREEARLAPPGRDEPGLALAASARPQAAEPIIPAAATDTASYRRHPTIAPDRLARTPHS